MRRASWPVRVSQVMAVVVLPCTLCPSLAHNGLYFEQTVGPGGGWAHLTGREGGEGEGRDRGRAGGEVGGGKGWGR